MPEIAILGGTPAMHYRARTYFPEIGRFSQRDPTTKATARAVYAYADNRPVDKADPLGLYTEAQLLGALGEVLAEKALSHIPGWTLIWKAPRVNAPGFDLAYYDDIDDVIRVVDNKAYLSKKIVTSSTALDANAGTNIAKLRDVIDSTLTGELRKKALAALERPIHRIITGYGGQVTHISETLSTHGVRFMGPAEVEYLASINAERLASRAATGANAISSQAIASGAGRLQSFGRAALRAGGTAVGAGGFWLTMESTAHAPTDPRLSEPSAILSHGWNRLTNMGLAAKDPATDEHIIPTDRLTQDQLREVFDVLLGYSGGYILDMPASQGGPKIILPSYGIRELPREFVDRVVGDMTFEWQSAQFRNLR
jgi:hypothetical protein